MLGGSKGALFPLYLSGSFSSGISLNFMESALVTFHCSLTCAFIEKNITKNKNDNTISLQFILYMFPEFKKQTMIILKKLLSFNFPSYYKYIAMSRNNQIKVQIIK